MKTSKERKETPIFSGVLNYFPLAIAAVAHQSYKGNEKHNPGQPLHWSREKSADHLDCATRHMMTPREIDVDIVCEQTGEILEVGSGQPHIVAAVWRLLAQAELILEEMRDADIAYNMHAHEPMSEHFDSVTEHDYAGYNLLPKEMLGFKAPDNYYVHSVDGEGDGCGKVLTAKSLPIPD